MLPSPFFMQVIHQTYNTSQEAKAFLDGIEFVNDSSVMAWISNVDNCVVVIEDEDGRDDEPAGEN